ncbi:metal-binding protein [Candidatus Magnetoovum chiemensis]|nr:metal-binding protein [Candidatus Magnetoovum chiemensis]
MEIQIVGDKKVQIKEKENIYEALKKESVYLVAPCGGKGTCGKCKVRVLEGRHECKNYGRLEQKERLEGTVLACQTTTKTNTLIEIPKQSRLVLGGKIAAAAFKDPVSYLKSYEVKIDPLVKRLFLELPPPSISDNLGDLERLKRALSESGFNNVSFSYEMVASMVETLRNANWNVMLSYVKDKNENVEALSLFLQEECSRRYGVAVDIGTTTVVVYLVDLVSGKVIDIGSTYNSQTRYGDDVITRIIFATEGGGLDDLREAVTSDINTIIDSFSDKHNINSCEIDACAISGNTTMSQIFWGLNPETIREEPYIPTLTYYPIWRAKTAQLNINPQSPVYTMPCIASYVGGDITSGILASKMHRNSEIALFMDIGTNAEVVIGNNEWLMTAACSAGPCFEGGGIKYGMRATAGAIESVKIDPDTLEPVIGVIGGVPPSGICGSGMIDAITEMFKCGIINQKGNFAEGKTKRIRLTERSDSIDGMSAFVSSKGSALIINVSLPNSSISIPIALIYSIWLQSKVYSFCVSRTWIGKSKP